MADIGELKIDVVRKFLSVNGGNVPADKIYTEAFELMNNSSTSYDEVDDSIIEWMMAYNALKRKVVNRIYSREDINKLSETEVSELAKNLGMRTTNIDRIINILRYMHLFNSKIYEETITGNYDVDKILLQEIDYQRLNNLAVNNYTKQIFDDQNFWKQRLEKRLGLQTNRNIDYKFVTKFLDNGKSFEENYQEALKDDLTDVINVLLDNNVVLLEKPSPLLEDINITIDELGEIKHYPYDMFIRYILNKNNEMRTELEEDLMDISYFDEKVYTGDGMIISILNGLYDPFDEKSQEFITVVFRNKNGFTNGEILYNIAQKIPNENEIKQNNIEFIRKHPDDILGDIKNLFPYLEKRGKRDIEDLNYLKKYYNIITVNELLKDPVKFLYYVTDHPNRYIRDYNSTDVWGDHVYWEGLHYQNGMYHISLGS